MNKHNKLLLALAALTLSAAPLASADPLKGEIQRAAIAASAPMLKAGVTADHNQPFYVESRVMSNPRPSADCINLPYYVGADHNGGSATFDWDIWWQTRSWDVLYKFDDIAKEPCALLFNVVITADGKVKADYVGAPSDNPIIQRMIGAIESLQGDPKLAFPPGSARQTVWFETLLTRNLGPYPKSAGFDYLFSHANVHPPSTQVSSNPINP